MATVEQYERMVKRLCRFLDDTYMDPFWVKGAGPVTPEAGERIDWAGENVCEQAIKIICEEIGHDPHEDQCRKPEHDFCLRCGDLTPGQAPGRKEPTP